MVTNGHCFAHGSFDGSHCPRCIGWEPEQTVVSRLRERVTELERQVEYLMDKDRETLT